MPLTGDIEYATQAPTPAEFGGRFYLPNARFTTPALPSTPYNAVSIRIP